MSVMHYQTSWGGTSFTTDCHRTLKSATCQGTTVAKGVTCKDCLSARWAKSPDVSFKIALETAETVIDRLPHRATNREAMILARYVALLARESGERNYVTVEVDRGMHDDLIQHRPKL